jgi:hypothetical protein
MAALKGAFIDLGAGILGGLPNIIVFQFNPDKVTRSPTRAQSPPRDDGSGTHDSSQTAGQPVEGISFTLRLDATDQLAQANPIAVTSGILPGLSALELLMVPRASPAAALSSLAGVSQASQSPAKLPVVLFFWGPLRILPVSIGNLSVTETEYDTLLNPIRAEVSISLQVLSEAQLQDSDLARGAYKYSQGVKQVMAALNLANAAQIGISSALSFSL